MATKNDVFKIALQAARQHQLGDNRWEHNGIVFILNVGGYCARFVRQSYEAALNSGEFVWNFIAPSAREMERKLRDAGLKTNNPEPGDIICLNNQDYWAGHIAIYAGFINGVKSIIENTSSSKRGNPQSAGTKITPLSDVIDELSGYYAALPADVKKGYYPGNIKVEVEGVGSVDGFFSDHGIVGVANIAKLLGYTVENRLS